MRLTRTTPVLTSLLAFALCREAAAVDPTEQTEDEQRLKAAKLGTDGPALLAFFRTRTHPEYDEAKITALVRDMGNDSDKVSSRAIRELISLGPVASPWLRRALKDPDDTLRAARAKMCLEMIEGGEGGGVPVAAARLLANRKAEGAARALLDYLPFADDDTVMDELRDSLAILAVVDGKPDEAVLQALKDKEPIRRAVAAEALCRAGAAGEYPLVRYLLKDSKPTVRMRAALALASVKDEQAIPVLIDSLGKLNEDQARLAEEQLLKLAGAQAPSVALGKDEATRKRCHDVWNTWWTSMKTDDLVAYFRKHTLDDADRDRFQALVKQLGSDSFKTRQKAMATLVNYRSAAVSILRQATNASDLEIRSRAEQCLAKIRLAPGASLAATYARVLGVRKPEKAVEVLLGYLPFADDESVTDEVRASLAAMAVQEGKPHRSLVAALRDRLPDRRLVAAEALLQAGFINEKGAMAHLLKDPEGTVRLRMAQALASAGDKTAVPVLIDLLTKLPVEDAWKAEETLRRLADDKVPETALGNDDASRQKARKAWEDWWKTRGAAINLVRLERAPRLLGYTIISQYNNMGVGELIEIGKGGKVRWNFSGLTYNTFDVQVLRGERILLAEYNASKVTERDFKGKVHWELSFQNPISAERLRNGNTLVAGRNMIVEYDKSKKEIFKITRPNFDIYGARKLRNGQLVMVTNAGTVIRMDTKGKEIHSFQAGSIGYYNCLEVTPNGNILVALYGNNKVAEFDPKGKQVWEATVQWPSSCTRLPNGHTLVACQDTQKIIEFDRKGKEVWSHQATGRPYCARRR
jgi:HEAT repeat protein